MKVGVLHNEDGTVAIVRPCIAYKTDEELQAIIDRANPNKLPYEIVDDSTLPEDRTFRNAWTNGEKCVIIDKDKADAIHMDSLRVIRNQQLADLDLKMLRAMEDADMVAMTEIKALKQELRDMPENVDLSKVSLDELKDFVPEVLARAS